jgi:hypothetical protein
MTELAYRDQDAVRVLQSDPTGGRLVAWASGLHAAHQIATALCQTTFVPKHFRGAPEEAAAAILFGDEIGLSPTNALRSIYVISGVPSLYARAMVALVLAHGHEIWTEDDTPSKVTVCGRRKNGQRIETITWTADRARKAGYTNNAKYTSDPQAMLYARASGDVARRVAPDLLYGLGYNVEELELQEQPNGKAMKRLPPALVEQPRRLARKPIETVELPEPELDDPTLPTQTTPPGDTRELPGEPTAAMRRMMHALFNKNGMADRTERLAFTCSVIGRDIASSDELTRAEAGMVLDALQAGAEGIDHGQDQSGDPSGSNQGSLGGQAGEPPL